MVVDKKKLKGTSFAIFGVGTAANSSIVQTEFAAEPTTKMKSSKVKFVLWTFRLPAKRQLSILLKFFFQLIKLYLTFAVFAKT